MTSRLWVFGDSFAEENSSLSQWHWIVAQKLNMRNVNTALAGTSIDWVYHRWNKSHKKFLPDDLVIIVLTDPTRRWMFKDHPQTTFVSSIEYNKSLDPDRKKAFLNYYRYLYDGFLEEVHLTYWLLSVSQSPCPVLILPAFFDTMEILKKVEYESSKIGIARGYLHQISINEHVENLRSREIEHDGRYNHITIPNHQILAQKIIDWYQDKQPVDLETGFLENLIDKTDLQSISLFRTDHRIAAG